MSDLSAKLNDFLEHRLEKGPLLLALSGGPDSLSLFYCLIDCQKKLGIDFHIAHVNHGWRKESDEEEKALKELAKSFGVPFHVKKLTPPPKGKGNLENAARQERYAFFQQLYSQYDFQGLILGHHANDKSETILKRVLEGSHWSNWGALQAESRLFGMRILRPFLNLEKEEIRDWLQKRELIAFEDQTNQDPRFLRGRMRQTIFPFLNEHFGKKIQDPLRDISTEMDQLKSYFDDKTDPTFKQIVQGPFGHYLDFTSTQFNHLVEISYVIRKVAELTNLHMSREAIQNAAEKILSGCANCAISTGNRLIWVDRHILFVPSEKEIFSWNLPLTLGKHERGEWIIDIIEKTRNESGVANCWRKGWLGEFTIDLPKGEYNIAPAIPNATCYNKKRSISKWWSQHKIPTFFSKYLPVIWNNNQVYHEFLTGKRVVESLETTAIEVKFRIQNSAKGQ